MAKRAEWKLSLADMMALVAATAMGVWVSVTALTQHGDYPNVERDNLAGLHAWFGATSKAAARVLMVWPCVGAWTFALPVLCLFRRRDQRRRLFRRPGVAACTAVAVASPGVFAWDLMLFREHGDFPKYDIFIMLFFRDLEQGAGPLIVATWVLMALGGRWCAEPTWVDRTGRVLGVLWVVVFFIKLLYVDYLL
jgi:hypothetical protein